MTWFYACVSVSNVIKRLFITSFVVHFSLSRCVCVGSPAIAFCFHSYFILSILSLFLCFAKTEMHCIQRQIFKNERKNRLASFSLMTQSDLICWHCCRRRRHTKPHCFLNMYACVYGFIAATFRPPPWSLKANLNAINQIYKIRKITKIQIIAEHKLCVCLGERLFYRSRPISHLFDSKRVSEQSPSLSLSPIVEYCYGFHSIIFIFGCYI